MLLSSLFIHSFIHLLIRCMPGTVPVLTRDWENTVNGMLPLASSSSTLEGGMGKGCRILGDFPVSSNTSCDKDLSASRLLEVSHCTLFYDSFSTKKSLKYLLIHSKIM